MRSANATAATTRRYGATAATPRCRRPRRWSGLRRQARRCARRPRAPGSRAARSRSRGSGRRCYRARTPSGRAPARGRWVDRSGAGRPSAAADATARVSGIREAFAALGVEQVRLLRARAQRDAVALLGRVADLRAGDEAWLLAVDDGSAEDVGVGPDAL